MRAMYWGDEAGGRDADRAPHGHAVDHEQRLVIALERSRAAAPQRDVTVGQPDDGQAGDASLQRIHDLRDAGVLLLGGGDAIEPVTCSGSLVP